MSTVEQAGQLADKLIATEVAIQDRMWGDTNDRADSTNNQLMDAAIAQQVLVKAKLEGEDPKEALLQGSSFYPPDWDGFRDYGSTVANLVVAAAYIRSEIKRRILMGEDTTRAKRDQPYVAANPAVSSEEAAASLPQD